MTAALAPPCNGPFSAAIAAVTAACISASVAATTRAVKVEALNSWSAWSTRILFIASTSSSLGSRSCNVRKNARAVLSSSTGGTTGSRPRRRRAIVATIVGTCATKRSPLATAASRATVFDPPRTRPVPTLPSSRDPSAPPVAPEPAVEQHRPAMHGAPRVAAGAPLTAHASEVPRSTTGRLPLRRTPRQPARRSQSPIGQCAIDDRAEPCGSCHDPF